MPAAAWLSPNVPSIPDRRKTAGTGSVTVSQTPRRAAAARHSPRATRLAPCSVSSSRTGEADRPGLPPKTPQIGFCWRPGDTKSTPQNRLTASRIKKRGLHSRITSAPDAGSNRASKLATPS
jgi:hypothetical protein